MQPSLESRFLLDSLRATIGSRAGAPDMETVERLDSDLFFSTAHFHRVVPLAYKAVSTMDPVRVPSAILKGFRGDMEAITLRSLHLTGEMLRLLDLLESEGVPTVAFKGPALSIQAYGDPFTRQFDDIDLLVSKANHEKAHALLASQGYTERGDVSHACELFHPDRRVAVDLHRWIPGPKGFTRSTSLTLDLDCLPTTAESLVFQDRRIRTFQVHDLLLVLCLHAAKHAWKRWSWLFDIGAVIARNPQLDWGQLARRSRELHVVEPVYLSLRLTETVCGTALSQDALRDLPVRPEIERLVQPLDSSIVQEVNPLRVEMRRYLLPFRTLTTTREKGKYFLWLLKLRITTTSADRELLDLPRPLRFLYFVIRPLRLLCEYGRNLAGYVALKLGRAPR